MLHLYRSLYRVAPRYFRRRAVTGLRFAVGEINVGLPDGGRRDFDHLDKSEIFNDSMSRVWSWRLSQSCGGQ